MTSSDATDALLVRRSSRAQLQPLLLIGLFVVAYPVLHVAGLIGRPVRAARHLHQA